MEKKVYSREEKIKYYQYQVLKLEFALKRATERLHYLMSDNYQEWDSTLAKDLAKKKAAR